MDEPAFRTLNNAESELSEIFSFPTLSTVILYLPAAKAGMRIIVLSVVALNTTFPCPSKTVTLREVKFSTSNSTKVSVLNGTSSIG